MTGGTHEKATDVEVVLDAIAVTAVGGSGTVGRIVSANEKVYSEYAEGVVTAVTLQV